MTIKDNFARSFNRLIQKDAKIIRLRYFESEPDDVYDDAVTLVRSGNDVWTSGIIIPIDKSNDGLLLQQGILLEKDKKLYTTGSLLFTGSQYSIKIGLGSPIEGEYAMIPEGTKMYESEGVPIYKRTYIRYLPAGSLIGEERI